jgi:small subunit ribosomal protein S21
MWNAAGLDFSRERRDGLDFPFPTSRDWGINKSFPDRGDPGSVVFTQDFQDPTGGRMSLRMRVHDKEPISLALRRFKKLIERSGMQKELRSHQHYEKPSELRRRARLRKEKAARKAREKAGT